MQNSRVDSISRSQSITKVPIGVVERQYKQVTDLDLMQVAKKFGFSSIPALLQANDSFILTRTNYDIRVSLREHGDPEPMSGVLGQFNTPYWADTIINLDELKEPITHENFLFGSSTNEQKPKYMSSVYNLNGDLKVIHKFYSKSYPFVTVGMLESQYKLSFGHDLFDVVNNLGFASINAFLFASDYFEPRQTSHGLVLFIRERPDNQSMEPQQIQNDNQVNNYNPNSSYNQNVHHNQWITQNEPNPITPGTSSQSNKRARGFQQRYPAKKRGQNAQPMNKHTQRNKFQKGVVNKRRQFLNRFNRMSGDRVQWNCCNGVKRRQAFEPPRYQPASSGSLRYQPAPYIPQPIGPQSVISTHQNYSPQTSHGFYPQPPMSINYGAPPISHSFEDYQRQYNYWYGNGSTNYSQNYRQNNYSGSY